MTNSEIRKLINRVRRITENLRTNNQPGRRIFEQPYLPASPRRSVRDRVNAPQFSVPQTITRQPLFSQSNFPPTNSPQKQIEQNIPDLSSPKEYQKWLENNKNKIVEYFVNQIIQSNEMQSLFRELGILQKKINNEINQLPTNINKNFNIRHNISPRGWLGLQYKASNKITLDFGELEHAFKVRGEYNQQFSIQTPDFIQNIENFTKKVLGKEVQEFLKWDNNLIPKRIDVPNRRRLDAVFELKFTPQTKNIMILPGLSITISFDAIMKNNQIQGNMIFQY